MSSKSSGKKRTHEGSDVERLKDGIIYRGECFFDADVYARKRRQNRKLRALAKRLIAKVDQLVEIAGGTASDLEAIACPTTG